MNTTRAQRTIRIERYDTIVIGAGQAGLATGYHLARGDADFLILESASRVGDSWRQRWDSLRVFTSAAFASLPGMPFPADPAHLPDEDELADYLERYADRFDLPVRTGTRVTSLSRNDGRYVIDTGPVCYQARNVVVATGPNHAPIMPSVAPDFSWIHLPLPVEGGAPLTRRGVVPGVPGLFFVGLRFQHTLASALIAGVGTDAAHIAAQVLAFEPP